MGEIKQSARFSKRPNPPHSFSERNQSTKKETDPAVQSLSELCRWNVKSSLVVRPEPDAKKARLIWKNETGFFWWTIQDSNLSYYYQTWHYYWVFSSSCCISCCINFVKWSLATFATSFVFASIVCLYTLSRVDFERQPPRSMMYLSGTPSACSIDAW